MGSMLRTVLVWIVALAMPVQGLAASTMRFCGSSHERMTQSAGADHHEAVTSATHDHAAAAHAANAADPDAAGKFTDLGQFKCSVCAACCSMLALPAGFALVGDPGLANVMSPAPSVVAPSYLSEGLERPPRAILA
jgi:hypothetical protein